MSTKTKYHIIPPKSLDYIRHGTSKPVAQMHIDEIPPVAISWGRTTVFKTGSWRNVTPHYIKRLPPCRAGCPVGNDVEGWLEAAGRRDWDEAVRLLLAEQPLPSICGRVCYHPCETACNRGEFDDAVSIREVERFLGDRAVRLGIMPEIVRRTRNSSGKVLIVGSGPSGLAAAWLLARFGYRVEVRERAPLPGGLLRYGIPDYRLPQNILDMELERLSELGITFRNNTAFSFDDSLTDVRKEFDAIYIATGAAGHRSSGITGGENIVIGAIEFLAQIAEGKTPDLTPPQPPPTIAGGGDRRPKVVVIGGGNSAIDAARSALRLGAEVTILYRRTRAEMPAYEEEVDAALTEGVKIEYLVSPLSVVTGAESPSTDTPSGNPEGNNGYRLRCIRNVLGEPDSSGRRRPEPIPSSEFEIPVDTIIDAVGEYPDPAQLTPDKDEQSALKPVDIWGRSGLGRIWVGGDFAGYNRTVADGIGAGKRAAISIDMTINGALMVPPDNLLFGVGSSITVQWYLSGDLADWYDRTGPVDFRDLNLAYHPNIRRTILKETLPDERRRDFSEIVYGWAMSAAVREAQRCFHCGTCDSCGNCHIFCPDGAVQRDPSNGELSIDLEYCKGCGVCAAECPRAAIEMFK